MAAQRSHADDVASLPQVLLAILDGVQSVAASEAEMASWVRKDPGIVAELLVSARAVSDPGTQRCHSVETAIAALGPDAVRAQVLDFASRHFFASRARQGSAIQYRIWRQALMAADLAQVLATLTRYREPEQARLCGLLLGAVPPALAARSRPETLVGGESDPASSPTARLDPFEAERVAVGIRMAEAWCPDSFAVDAMRYQFAPVAEVGDAHHLVKIVNLARHLAMDDENGDEAIRAAYTLFGLEPELARTLRQRVAVDVDRLAGTLGVIPPGADSDALAVDAHQALGLRLDAIARMTQARMELRDASDAASIRTTVSRLSRRLLGIEHGLLFLVDAQGEHLCAWLEGDEEPAFVAALTAGRSLVAKTLLEEAPQRGAGQAVVDRQLAGLLRARQLWCLPLLHGQSRLGVLVLGLPPGHEDVSTSGEAEAAAFASEVAALLAARSAAKVRQGASGARADWTGRAQLRFAVSTPLSVIHNHLEMLRARVGDDSAALDDLERIAEEAVRLERILGEQDLPPTPPMTRDVALNDLVQDVVVSLDAGLLAPAGIRSRLDLDPRAPRVRAPPEVQSLLRHLLQHAGETLQAGSEVVVATRGPVSVNGREHVELELRDNGPGLPDGWIARWSGAEADEAGGGRAEDLPERIRALTDAMGGTMIFNSDRSGTRIQVLLPGSVPDDPEPRGRGFA